MESPITRVDKNTIKKYQHASENTRQTGPTPAEKRSLTSWVETDRKALEHNLYEYKKVIRPALLAPVIKSNAYGCGIEHIAHILDGNELVDLMCVVTAREALFLRSVGTRKMLVVLSILDANLEEIILQDIDVVVYDMRTILELNRAGERVNKKAYIHLKVDTGLSRLGFTSDDIMAFMLHLCSLPFVSIRGICTHFSESESSDQTFTDHQIKQFDSIIERLGNMGITIPLKHAACSAAATANRASHYNVVRLGIGLYGLWPSCENKEITECWYPQLSLKPVLTWKTRIIQIRDIAAGSYIGYDRTHQVHGPARIALLPVGYWDGYDRRLSNKGHVLVNNHVAPIIGRVAMNLSTIDITGLQVSIDDDVTLIGNHPGLTAHDLAAHCDTISYEIVTRINPLLPRYIAISADAAKCRAK